MIGKRFGCGFSSLGLAMTPKYILSKIEGWLKPANTPRVGEDGTYTLGGLKLLPGICGEFFTNYDNIFRPQHRRGYPLEEEVAHTRNSVGYIAEINDRCPGGFNNWRLPDLKELLMLGHVARDLWNLYEFYWSSDQDPDNPMNAMGVILRGGEPPRAVSVCRAYHGNILLVRRAKGTKKSGLTH